MNKLEYLKLAIINKLYNNLSWVIIAFAISTSKAKENYKDYELTRIDGNYSFYDPITKTLLPIKNPKNVPLYSFSDIVNIDKSWLSNIKKPITSRIGNLITNAILLVDNFKDKIDYINGNVRVSDIEDIIALKLSKEETSDTITVKEYLSFVDSTTYLQGFSSLAVIAATKKNILPPEGIEKKMGELLDKYKGKLDDPIHVAELEAELMAFDKEYLKDDPSLGKFASGKVLNIARKKLFLTYGAEFGFGTDNKIRFIPKPLVKGWGKDPKDIVALYNSTRFGSFSRGNLTQEGGLSAKISLRATNTLTIFDGDCGTNLTMKFTPNVSNIEGIVGRNILINNKVVNIEDIDAAKKYIGKTILMRSPQYCKQPKQEFCSVCVGKKMALHKEGIPLSVTEVTGGILTSAMKAMHVSGSIVIKELSLEETFS